MPSLSYFLSLQVYKSLYCFIKPDIYEEIVTSWLYAEAFIYPFSAQNKDGKDFLSYEVSTIYLHISSLTMLLD